MNTIRRNLLTSHPNIGFTASVTTAVPMKSQRIGVEPAAHADGVARRPHHADRVRMQQK
jgi:hypothetical protein